MKTGWISFGECYAVNRKDIMCRGDANLRCVFRIACLQMFVCICGFNLMEWQQRGGRPYGL